MLKKILGLFLEFKVKLVGETKQTRFVSRQRIVSQQAREQIKRIRSKGLSLPVFIV